MYFEISAKNEDNIKKAFYSSIAELNFFDMNPNYNKEKLIKELEIENENNKDNDKNNFLFKKENHENQININNNGDTKSNTKKSNKKNCEC